MRGVRDISQGALGEPGLPVWPPKCSGPLACVGEFSFFKTYAKLVIMCTNPFLKFCLKVLLEKYLICLLISTFTLYKMFGRKRLVS